MRGNNQKNSNIMIKTCIFMSLIIFLLCFIVILCIAFSSDDTYEIEKNGERYGKSEFYKYKDKIYVLVIGSGMLEVEGVDIPTFKAFDKDKEDERGNVGFDKNKIYFGNIAVSDLDTDKLYYVGNNYYSDGTNSYFCSTSPKFNEELSAGTAIIQNISHFFSKTRKPQNYFYPYKKLETNKRLKKFEELRNFATNGEEVYYAGEKLANADINTIKKIEEGLFYFVDKENVYYKSKLLSFKNNGKLKVFHEKNGNVYYLYDEESGDVYADDCLFNTANAPYKVIGLDGTHNFSLLFISKDGVYFYEPFRKKQERIGNNIFKGEIKEIYPNIFSDDENVYYLDVYEDWASRSGNNPFSLMKKPLNGQLISRNTRICYLDKKTAWENDWKKVADINFGGDGSIWKKGNKYYYFDIYGFNQNINRTIYEIVDKEVLDYLLNFSNLKDGYSINLPSKINDFIAEGKLIAFNGEVKMTATIHFIEDPYAYSIPKIIFISIAFLIGLYARYRFDIANFLKKRKKSKFSKK
ncbi:DKNYY domain-containing protein [Fusobacterium polymorphum]|uniref:DKNYY domain-containing protein n=1 Tax=Fusobacterium nucleatum subsp. polymorphum TaxID=76857 RepID=UPI001C6E08E4|nr:DKNYY domain-containing protein [Fusobacterium polymorphum]QYR58833.1 DKNYY domain-containing protein [Fusobacterium polymorphum]